MRVISTFLPSEVIELTGKNTALMVFDTLVGNKSLVVGITVGEITGNSLKDVRVSAIGQSIIERGARHHRLNYPEASPVVVAGVQSVGNAVKRVTKVLSDAPENAFVLIVCKDDKVYDAAFIALNVNYGTTDEEM